jgi:hypothetical protein
MESLIHKVIFSAICMFLLSEPLNAEIKSPSNIRSENLERVNNLGEEFQRQGPWSRKSPQDGGFYDIPQPDSYLATPESQLPKSEPEVSAVPYPLCYNPYIRVYEYCYSGDSSYFQSRFSSPQFRFWWKRGRTCPPGYYFVPEEGCYRY